MRVSGTPTPGPAAHIASPVVRSKDSRGLLGSPLAGPVERTTSAIPFREGGEEVNLFQSTHGYYVEGSVTALRASVLVGGKACTSKHRGQPAGPPIPNARL